MSKRLELRRRLEELVRGFLRGRRRGLLLALVSALRLRDRGEAITAENVAKEGREIIRRTHGRIDWGVREEEFTETLVSELLEELVEMGVLEPDPEVIEELGKRYRFRSYEEPEDAHLEALKAAAPILLRAV